MRISLAEGNEALTPLRIDMTRLTIAGPHMIPTDVTAITYTFSLHSKRMLRHITENVLTSSLLFLYGAFFIEYFGLKGASHMRRRYLFKGTS